jgi:hypothetical protein
MLSDSGWAKNSDLSNNIFRRVKMSREMMKFARNCVAPRFATGGAAAT